MSWRVERSEMERVLRLLILFASIYCKDSFRRRKMKAKGKEREMRDKLSEAIQTFHEEMNGNEKWT